MNNRRDIVLGYLLEPILSACVFVFTCAVLGADVVSNQIEKQIEAYLAVVGGFLAVTASRYVAGTSHHSTTAFERWMTAIGSDKVFQKAECAAVFIHAVALVSLLAALMAPMRFINLTAGFMLVYATVVFFTFLNNLRVYRQLESSFDQAVSEVDKPKKSDHIDSPAQSRDGADPNRN